MVKKKTIYLQVVKKAFEKLRNLNNKIKKFNLKIKIKGDNSMLDSVDTITFFSLLDSEIQKNKLKNPDFMNENFFFKYKDISIQDVIYSVKKINDKK
jgi:hypothetical protein|tara:strand:- start:2888 stop:3178 length:291 start_codon:yes stop_codon:yes gene_type:complete